MIDVSQIVRDPDFAQNYEVIRQTGEWNAGRFEVTGTKTLNYRGAVQPTDKDTLQQLPENDRTSVSVSFYCSSPNVFYMTQESDSKDDESQVIFDRIKWRGNQYKIIKVLDWSRNGYQIAVGVEQ